MSRILAGPWCTQLLGDLGAEVIKIEHPERGDDTRQWGPPWLKDTRGNETEESSYYLSTNRNKASVALDIKTNEGREILKNLVTKSDIFIENFKVGGLKKYGLDYESLQALNPGLIYVSITGFGQTGPMSSQPGYDYLIQGLGGLMSITGQPDDEPGGGPQRVGVAISDITTGLYATIGILSALRHRDRTGEGQYIDLALLDTQVGWLANQASNYLTG
ncbi:MAG: CaiB/BaiF CoA transferase family protein, partial [bacterium]